MNSKVGGIKSFTDLDAWKEAHRLVLEIYKITNSFPSGELFGLISRMKRSGVSVTSSIAEGFGRHSYEDKIRFYSIAIASAVELHNQIIVSRDVGFIDGNKFADPDAQCVRVQKIINGLIRSSKSRFNIRTP